MQKRNHVVYAQYWASLNNVLDHISKRVYSRILTRMQDYTWEQPLGRILNTTLATLWDDYEKV